MVGPRSEKTQPRTRSPWDVRRLFEKVHSVLDGWPIEELGPVVPREQRLDFMA